VTVIEALETILAGADADLIRPVVKRAEKAFKEIRYKTKVTKMATKGKKIQVISEKDGKTVEELYDRVLVSVGRVPNAEDLGLENTKVEQDEKGFIKVNEKQETSDPNIFAIGDIAKAAIGLELLDALHQADVAFGDEVADRQSVPAIAHGDLGHEPQVRRHELRRSFGVVVFLVALGEHVFLLGRQHGEFLDFGEVAVEALLSAQCRHAQCFAVAHVFPKPF
jgi:NADPH-dependent 2,4-dienoyl-CoA reductase/sulfur reductase-like enzyme